MLGVFEKFRNNCLKNNVLSTGHYFSCPDLSWDAAGTFLQILSVRVLAASLKFALFEKKKILNLNENYQKQLKISIGIRPPCALLGNPNAFLLRQRAFSQGRFHLILSF